MRNRITLYSRTVLVLCLALPALAFNPIAKVTSAEPFTLDGRSMTTAGMPVPLAVGDEVATSSAPAVLYFADGSSVKLAAASCARLMGSESRPKLVLLAGALDYKVVLGSSLSVTNLDVERKTPVVLSVRPAPKPLATPRPDEVTMTIINR